MNFFLLRYYFILLVVGLFSQSVFSQSKEKELLLIQNVKDLMNSNPEQAINITKLLLGKSSVTDAEKAKINFLAAKIYKIKGDYSNSLKFLYEEKKFDSHLDEKEKLLIELEKINVLRELALKEEANDLINAFENKKSDSESNNLKTFKEASIVLEKVKFLLLDQKSAKGIELLQNQLQASNNLKEFPELALSYTITFGQLYLENKNSDEAKKYFEKALQIINQKQNYNNYEKVFALLGLSNVYFQAKNHEEANVLLKEAYTISIGLQNTYLQEAIIKNLSINYLALNDIQNYKLTSVSLIQKQTEIEALEQEGVNTAYNLISQVQSEKYLNQEANYYRIAYVVIGVSLLFIAILVFLWWQIFQKKKRLNEIINYLNVTRNNFINKISVKVEESKKINIPKETEELLLKKLEKFESSTRFTNKDISLSVLSGQLDTNTKYLSEVINSNYHVNFNTYINKLRINYIVEKLKKDPNFMNYKISYLAENCGFSSHSSFATVFKSITEISPVTFIELLRKEKENTQANDL